METETFANKTLAFSNPNDPNIPKPTLAFGQSQPFGSSTPATPAQTITPQQQQTAFGVSSTPAGNPPIGTGTFGQQQQQQTSTFGQQSGFGSSTSSNVFGSQTGSTSTPGGLVFGSQTGGGNSAPGGGGFGMNTDLNKPSLFGTGLTNTPSAFGGATLSGFGGIIHHLIGLTCSSQFKDLKSCSTKGI